MTGRTERDGETELPSTELLRRLAQELAAQASEMERMQTAISPMIRAFPPDADGVQRLQAMDCLTQSLDGLARLGALVASCSGSGVGRAEAREALRLEELCTRILGDPVRAEAADAAPDQATMTDDVTWL